MITEKVGSGTGAAYEEGAVDLRAADPRLLAPGRVDRVALVGRATAWESELTAAGLVVTDQRPDLVLGDRAAARAAAALGAPAVVLIGGGETVLRSAGYQTYAVLTRPGAVAPRLYVPVDSRAAVRHALLAPIEGRTRVRRVAACLTALATRLGAPLADRVIVGARNPGLPRVLDIARAHGAGDLAGWYLVAGTGDDLQRLVWFCFAAGAAEPEAVVKCSRVAGNVGPFERDEQALARLDPLPPALRARAPRILARFEVDGLPASVESAGAGQPLHQQRDDTGGVPARTVAAVADWIVEVGEATRAHSDALAPERERLEHEVLGHWRARGAPDDLVRSLPPVAAVLQHNDLGCWNIVAEERSFTVVDWESSRAAGLPLWDLVYFLTDALSTRAGAGGPDAKHTAVLDLLRGRLAESAQLFALVGDAAARCAVPHEAIGPIVTLGWLHHGLSRDRRGAAAADHAVDRVTERGPLERVATAWLEDPALGVRWAAFSER